ncbi:unnamed protein product [Urochloa decumbens]|uniref:F-box domain-containing protein n=1 Tax=Urochloa decumbens TaxID=240449 RepID=A0ABC9FPF1_9POAL
MAASHLGVVSVKLGSNSNDQPNQPPPIRSVGPNPIQIGSTHPLLRAMQPPKARRRRRRRRRRSPRRRPRPSPQLVDDAISEILLRLPPDDPSCLARASAVCRTWRRVLAEPAFAARYRALHWTPPVLGSFLHDAAFVPTTAFRPPAADYPDSLVVDCRHGRVLLEDRNSEDLAVWDPITGVLHRLPKVPDFISFNCNSAVLCAAAGAGCGHLDCHGGPFVVALLGDGRSPGRQIHACLYSSETGAWSAHASIELDPIELDSYYTSCLTVDVVPAALVGDALYFIGDFGNEILRYDLVDPILSVVDPPDVDISYDGVVVMPEEDGGLGFAVLKLYHLYLWSMDTGPDGDAGWANHRVINLETMLPPCNLEPVLSGFVESANAIVVTSDIAVFTIELKSLRIRKVCKRDEAYCGFLYTGFFIPVCASGRLPSLVASGELSDLL